ncbi:MAG: rRNA maturation RNase YbeY [Clostridia bacterium]|nr:rRNA maturation RNase YbeY [Clostridia bacterium]
MKPKIWIENNQSEKAPFRGYKTVLRRAIGIVLEEEGFHDPCEISVSLVTREEIRRLNGEFRQVDRETDVLSFPMLEEGEEPLPGKRVCLGDIILCPAVILEQSTAFGTTFRQEMCLMVIHSTLHLLGWDHMEEKAKEEMFALQEKLFASLGEGEIKTEKERMGKEAE